MEYSTAIKNVNSGVPAKPLKCIHGINLREKKQNMKLGVHTVYSFAKTRGYMLTVMGENLEARQWFYVEAASSFYFSLWAVV